MLEHVDLSTKLNKGEYKKLIGEYRLKLGELQRKAMELNIPVIIVFEGWDAAGKGTLINRLLLALDARGYTVHSTGEPTTDEKMRPFLWRFWTRTPERGRIAVFDRSWYGRLVIERVEKIVKKKTWTNAYDEIKSFERQLAEDGYVIAKFFLHISKKEQKTRLRRLEKNKSTSWKVTPDDWENHKRYDKFSQAIEDKLSRTDTEYAPWTIVEAHDRRYATVKVFGALINALHAKIEKHQNKTAQPMGEQTLLSPVSSSILEKVDLSLSLTREEYNRDLKKYQKRIRELEYEVYKKRIPVVILYEGWDAAGKGGNIRRLIGNMDPRGYEVLPVAAPNDFEKAHHYLWRFWRKLPKAGHIGIFDRTWYGRVMVERVEGFCKPEEWQRAYREINEMEEQIVNFGAVLVKFWVHIDPDEQLRRFEARKESPYKSWKITDEDWRNREKWTEYQAAIEEMIFRTSSSRAPWTIVESNCKLYARIKALRTVIAAIEAKL